MTQSNYNYSHSFPVNIAVEIDVHAACVYQHISYWIRVNETDPRANVDGRVWTFQTVSHMAHNMPYLSVKQINRSLDLLIKHGYLIKGHHCKNRFDRTTWYSLPILPSGKIDSPSPISLSGKSEMPDEENDHILEDTKEDPKDINTEAPDGASAADAACVSPDSSSKKNLHERALHVSTTDDQHSKLLEKFGQSVTERAYLKLSVHKQQTKKSKWKINDYLSLLNWTIGAIQDEDRKAERLKKGSPYDPPNRCDPNYPGKYDDIPVGQ